MNEPIGIHEIILTNGNTIVTRMSVYIEKGGVKIYKERDYNAPSLEHPNVQVVVDEGFEFYPIHLVEMVKFQSEYLWE